ncbi:MAG: helix-turn-helix transcriptional regulator [Chloroflexota bacterium]|jgi:DNA-binding HxlR family transcriptional regulator
MNYATLKQTHVCPVETGLELIGGRWKARILWKLYNGTLRFGELRRGLPGITEKMLAQQLKEMEQDQLIIRTQYPEMPPRVEYSLSEFGRSLTPVLEALKAWGAEHQEQIRQVILVGEAENLAG